MIDKEGEAEEDENGMSHDFYVMVVMVVVVVVVVVVVIVMFAADVIKMVA